MMALFKNIGMKIKKVILGIAFFYAVAFVAIMAVWVIGNWAKIVSKVFSFLLPCVAAIAIVVIFTRIMKKKKEKEA